MVIRPGDAENRRECLSCDLAPGSACYFGGDCRTDSLALQPRRPGVPKRVRRHAFRYAEDGMERDNSNSHSHLQLVSDSIACRGDIRLPSWVACSESSPEADPAAWRAKSYTNC